MKEDNNFKKVYETEAPDELKERSLKNTQGSVSTMRSFFSVLDLYITKFFGAIIHPFKDNSNNSLSAGTPFGFSLEKEEPIDNEEEGVEDDEDEDWYSDDDIPDDLIKS